MSFEKKNVIPFQIIIDVCVHDFIAVYLTMQFVHMSLLCHLSALVIFDVKITKKEKKRKKLDNLKNAKNLEAI